MGGKQDGSSFQGVLLIVTFVVKGSGYNNNHDSKFKMINDLYRRSRLHNI